MSHDPRTSAKLRAEEANSAGNLPRLVGDQTPLREKDLLTLNRRRTQRVLMRVRVRVLGHNGTSQLDEETHTLAVNAYGASILLSASVKNGQSIKLVNEATGDEAECIIVHVGQLESGRLEIGVSFVLPNPNFWHVTFPPHNWTPPEVEGSD